MNKSQLPTIAKRILKKLNASQSKDIVLYVRDDKCEVLEYGEKTKYPNACGMNFDYTNAPLPTQEELEESLYNAFIKVK